MKKIMKYALYFFLVILSLVAQPLRNLPESTFGAPLNTQNAEYNPIISPDGRYIVFQSDRPGGEGGMDLWLSENKNYKDRTGEPIWTEPVNFRELNTPSYEGGFSLLFDKDNVPSEIYFSSYSANTKNNASVDTRSTKDGYDGLNIYYTKRNRNGKWSLPLHLNVVNSNFDDRMPAISPDGKTLLFSSNRPGGYGKYDLWMSKRDTKTNTWNTPRNVGGEINSPANEIMPTFHFDGMSVFYSSDKDDEDYKFSFYTADFSDYRFANAKILSEPFNSEKDDEGLSITHDGIWIYYSSNKPGGEGQFDIYRAPFPEYLRKHYPFVFNGLVLDGSEPTMIGIDSTIHIFNEKGYIRTITSKKIGGDLSQHDNINFETTIETGYLYKVEFSAPGFHPTELTLDLRGNVGQNKSRYEKVVLMPIREIKKEEPKEKFMHVVLKDFMTKAIIKKGKVTQFTEKERDGTELKQEEEHFIIENLPKEDFELLAQAPGYKDETVFIKKDSETIKEKKDIDIYMRKLTDIPAIYKKNIYFAFNEYLLTKKQTEFLDTLAGYLLEHPEDILEIGGHTDNVAGKDYNVQLSQQRADEVKKYLVKKGIAKERLYTRAYWYSQPIGDNKTAEGRAKNRRVNFKKLN